MPFQTNTAPPYFFSFSIHWKRTICFCLVLHPVYTYKNGFKNLHKLPLLPFIHASRQITNFCFTYEALYKSTRTLIQLEKNLFHFCRLPKKTLTFAPTITTKCSLKICQKICLFKQTDFLIHWFSDNCTYIVCALSGAPIDISQNVWDQTFWLVFLLGCYLFLACFWSGWTFRSLAWRFIYFHERRKWKKWEK